MSPEPNAAQREFWNGDESREWVVEADRYDGMLAPFTEIVLGAADLRPDERVLDIGCGNGALALAAARQVPEGAVTGVDISAPMLEIATGRANAAGLDNVAFTLGDAQTDAISGQFDVAISRFGIMFFEDPVVAFTNIRSALAPGARVAFVCWRPMLENEWTAVPAGALLQHVPPPELPPPGAPGPFAFGEAGSLERSLTDAGFVEVRGDAVDAPMLLGGPGTLDDAFGFAARNRISRGFLVDVADDVRERALAAMREAMSAYATDEGVRMNGAIWLVRARVA